MKKKTPLRFLAMALTLCLSLSGFAVLADSEEPTLPVFGSDVNIAYGINSSENENGIQPMATSLITYHNVSIERKIVSGQVMPGWCIVKAVTQCEKAMGKIGFTGIEVIKSGPNIIDDVRYQISEYMYENTATGDFERQFYLETGYYYHVHIIHYAKESGWLFPKSQSIEDWTGMMYFGA